MHPPPNLRIKHGNVDPRSKHELPSGCAEEQKEEQMEKEEEEEEEEKEEKEEEEEEEEEEEKEEGKKEGEEEFQRPSSDCSHNTIPPMP